LIVPPGPPITTICFDWDGTLCDSGAASLRAFRQSLAEFGVTFTDAQYRNVYTPRWYLMYEAFDLPKSCWPMADREWLKHYRKEQPGLVPGVSALLERLRERRMRLGIVTNGTRGRVEAELARFGLASTFAAVVCYEDVTQPKPHPEGLEKAFVLLGCSPGACCFVGDTPEDIHMGRHAGVFTVGIRSEYVDDSRLRECGPDLLLNAITELPGALGC